MDGWAVRDSTPYITRFGKGESYGYDVAIQSNGKIVAAGQTKKAVCASPLPSLKPQEGRPGLGSSWPPLLTEMRGRPEILRLGRIFASARATTERRSFLGQTQQV